MNFFLEQLLQMIQSPNHSFSAITTENTFFPTHRRGNSEITICTEWTNESVCGLTSTRSCRNDRGLGYKLYSIQPIIIHSDGLLKVSFVFT